MTNFGCAVFVAKGLSHDYLPGTGLRALEVGSRLDYGGYRAIADLHGGFSEYVGVDIEEGPGVDVVCEAERLVERFGTEAFDAVITTELIEHVRDWRLVVSNLKNVCRPGGIIIVTTRSKGYGYHAAPYDFWRYELSDMENIFSDCEILLLEKDLEEPGGFVKVRKPEDFVENDLSEYCLLSIMANRRMKEIDLQELNRVSLVFLTLRAKFWQLGQWLFSYQEKDYRAGFKGQLEEMSRLLREMRRR